MILEVFPNRNNSVIPWQHPVPTLHTHCPPCMPTSPGSPVPPTHIPALHRQVVLTGMGWDRVGSPAQVCRGARAAPGHARSPSGQEGLTSITALPLPCCWLAGHATQKYCREFLIEVLLGEIKQWDVKGSTSLASTVWDYRLSFSRWVNLKGCMHKHITAIRLLWTNWSKTMWFT